MTHADSTVDHQLSDRDEHIHHVWDNDFDPVLSVEPGDVVRFECRDATDGQLGVDSTAEDVPGLDIGLIHPLTGPGGIEGAQAGNVLQVELLDLQHKGWGYTGFFPGEMGLGLLPEDFPAPGLHIWDLDDDVGHFVNGIEVPLDPFPGVIGVAPEAEGEHDTSRRVPLAVTSTSSTSRRGRRSISRSRSTVDCSAPATATPRKAMAKCA